MNDINCKKCNQVIGISSYWYCDKCIWLLLDSINDKAEPTTSGRHDTSVDSLADSINAMISQYKIKDAFIWWATYYKKEDIKALLSKVWVSTLVPNTKDITHIKDTLQLNKSHLISAIRSKIWKYLIENKIADFRISDKQSEDIYDILYWLWHYVLYDKDALQQ